MIFTCFGVNILPSTLPSSASKGLIHRFTVRTDTCQRAASCKRVIGCSSLSFIFDDFEGVRVGDGFAVDDGDGLLQGGKVDDTVFASANGIGGGEHGKMGRVGEKQWRNGGESMPDGNQVAVVLAARQEHCADGRVGRVGDVGAAIVAHKQSVLE